jgi:hypothetical protein
LRRADLDVGGHVNNAAYWQALEEELADRDPAAGLYAEVEHRGPCGVEEAQLLSAGERRWIVKADGTVVASFEVRGCGSR